MTKPLREHFARAFCPKQRQVSVSVAKRWNATELRGTCPEPTGELKFNKVFQATLKQAHAPKADDFAAGIETARDRTIAAASWMEIAYRRRSRIFLTRGQTISEKMSGQASSLNDLGSSISEIASSIAPDNCLAARSPAPRGGQRPLARSSLKVFTSRSVVLREGVFYTPTVDGNNVDDVREIRGQSHKP